MFNITSTVFAGEKAAMNEALSAIIAHGTHDCEIVDNETGEILFTYRNGNVQYIEGEFATKLLLEWEKRCH